MGGGVKTYVEALMTLDEAPLRLDPGQVIFEAGDRGSELFIVYSEGRSTTPLDGTDLENRGFVVKINRLFRY